MPVTGWEQQIRDYADRMMAEHGIPGLSLGLAEKGKVIFEEGFGYRDVEERLPVTPDTVFGIASITKSFTCAAVMMLAERGLLNIDDPVGKHIPELRWPDDERASGVTIHHFMTHTSGLPPLPTLFRAMARSMEGDPSVQNLHHEVDGEKQEPIDTYDQLIDFISNYDFEPLGPPGTVFSYSNDAYALLGAIIERVSGKSYAGFVTEGILEPAWMESSTFDVHELEKCPEVTGLYAAKKDDDGRETVYAAPGWWHAPSMVAAGFLRSTVPDLLRYLEIYRTGGEAGGERILSEESVARMTEPHAKCGPGMYYGYGLMITPGYNGFSLVEHGGSLKGISSQVAVVPKRGITGAILTNLVRMPASQTLLGAVNVRLGLPPETRRVSLPDCPCSPELLQAYQGEYRSDEGARIKVTAEDGTLTLEANEERHQARPVGEHLFALVIKGEQTHLQFLPDDKDNVYGIYFGLRIIRRAQDE